MDFKKGVATRHTCQQDGHAVLTKHSITASTSLYYDARIPINNET